MLQSVQAPFPVFTDIDGTPLDAGYIYIGQVGFYAQTNQINAYWDSSLTQIVVQPIRTIGGYPSNNGIRSRVYVGSDYSIAVMNRNNAQVYESRAVTERYSSEIVSYVGPDGRETTVSQTLTNLIENGGGNSNQATANWGLHSAVDGVVSQAAVGSDRYLFLAQRYGGSTATKNVILYRSTPSGIAEVGETGSPSGFDYYPHSWCSSVQVLGNNVVGFLAYTPNGYTPTHDVIFACTYDTLTGTWTPFASQIGLNVVTSNHQISYLSSDKANAMSEECFLMGGFSVGSDISALLKYTGGAFTVVSSNKPVATAKHSSLAVFGGYAFVFACGAGGDDLKSNIYRCDLTTGSAFTSYAAMPDAARTAVAIRKHNGGLILVSLVTDSAEPINNKIDVHFLDTLGAVSLLGTLQAPYCTTIDMSKEGQTVFAAGNLYGRVSVWQVSNMQVSNVSNASFRGAPLVLSVSSLVAENLLSYAFTSLSPNGTTYTEACLFEGPI